MLPLWRNKENNWAIHLLLLLHSHQKPLYLVTRFQTTALDIPQLIAQNVCIHRNDYNGHAGK